MADITVHLMPEVSNPSQLKPSFLLLNAFSQINALIHMLTAAQLPLHGLSCETFIKVWDGEHCLTMKLFNLRNALGPNCTSPFLNLLLIFRPLSQSFSRPRWRMGNKELSQLWKWADQNPLSPS
ncbi:hypothetical protein CK203_032358 [Vitis vinifera]|uniref:Uncharacterized protein n=1 Tax=Vitis vinifera TaxID=29760 RepID=A0A438IJV3_VITVI|nr:hypothetical protein CK203_032358 [Vitis vinifera]